MFAVSQFEQTSATFDTLIGDSCSAMPPLVRCPRLLETVFFTTRTCSTRTVPLSGNTRSTRPVLPRSEPVRIFTTSLRRIFKLGIYFSETVLSSQFLVLSSGSQFNEFLYCELRTLNCELVTPLPVLRTQSSKTSSRAVRELLVR